LLLPAIRACLAAESAQPAVIADARQLEQGQAAITVRDANAVFTGCLYDDRTARVIGREPIILTLEEKHHSIFFSSIEYWFPGEQPCNAIWKVRDLQAMLVGWTFISDCGIRRQSERYYKEVLQPQQNEILGRLGDAARYENDPGDAIRFVLSEMELVYPDTFIPRHHPQLLEEGYIGSMTDLMLFATAFERRMDATARFLDANEVPFWQDAFVQIIVRHLRLPPGRIDRAKIDSVYQDIIDRSDDAVAFMERNTMRFNTLRWQGLPASLSQIRTPTQFDEIASRLVIYLLVSFRFDPEELRLFLDVPILPRS